jgi:hypothetical protein
MKSKIVLMLVFALGACSQLLTYMPPHYRVSMDSTTELKQIGGSNISVGPFTLTAEFDNDCGITAGSVVMPDKMRVEDYIRNGLVEELKAAGMFDDTAPKITLTGTIDQLDFFSRRYIYTSTWHIGLLVKSSNGNSVHITDQYNFDAGAFSQADCQKVANSFLPAVQNIIAKVIDAPEFQSLVTNSNPL